MFDGCDAFFSELFDDPLILDDFEDEAPFDRLAEFLPTSALPLKLAFTVPFPVALDAPATAELVVDSVPATALLMPVIAPFVLPEAEALAFADPAGVEALTLALPDPEPELAAD